MLANILKNPNKYIPLSFVLFFIVLAILDGIFVYLAVSTQTGVVTKNAYEKGLNYNEAIKLADISKNYPQKLSVNIMGNNKVEINYNIESQIIFNDVTYKAIRPTKRGYDNSGKIKYNSATNSYSKNLELPLAGIWDILVIAKSGDIELRKKERIFVK